GLMAVLDGPDDVLRPEGRVAAEEYAGARRFERHRIDDRHAPLVELDAEIALDPRERVLLADREDDLVARNQHLFDDAAAHDAPSLVEVVLELVEAHSDELAVLDDERFRRVVDDDLDAFLLRVLELPFRGLEELARLARHDFHVLRAEPERAAAAVHGRVADADDQHALADRVDVAERDRLEPLDADMNAVRVAPPGKVEILALRRAAADEDRVEAFVEQRPHALHRRREPQVRAHVDDVADLLVEHARRQAKRRDIRAHQPAGLVVRRVDHALVAERQQIVRDRERRGSRADQRDALTVSSRGRLRQPARDVAAPIGCGTLQATDGNRLLLDPAASAGRLAGTVADPTENARENVRPPVEEISIV